MVREDEYLRLRAAEEDLEDVRLYDEAKAKPSEFIPLELTERMLNGENPIRVYREYRGFTQDQLGAQAGISKPFLSQIENGIRTPSLETLKRLAEVLRVDMDDLV
jgi:DNA-binding XRE family transcriptional regulator